MSTRPEDLPKNNYIAAVNLLIEVAKYGYPIWDEPIFRDGYRKVNSGLIGDIRHFLKTREGIDLEKIDD